MHLWEMREERMRAIDGDRLKRKAQKVATEAWKMKLTAKVETTLNQFIDWIDAQPTIEPERKKGKWVGYDGDWLKTMCKCSECGAMIDINEKYRNFFCYHCGSDMREDVLPSAQPTQCNSSNVLRHPQCANRTKLGNCDPVGGFCTSVPKEICDAQEHDTLNGSDLIDRQAAIDAVDEGLTMVFVEHRDIAEKIINKIPSAQADLPIKEKCAFCPHCNNCDVNDDLSIQPCVDTISRQAVIENICTMLRNCFDASDEMIESVKITVGELPSAQLEPTAHGSIYVEMTEKQGDRTTDGLISRKAAIDLFPNDDLEWDTNDGYIAPHLARQMICELPSAQQTLYGYDIEHLKLIANVLQKENLPPERVTDALMDIERIVAIVRDEFEETLRKAVEQCMI